MNSLPVIGCLLVLLFGLSYEYIYDKCSLAKKLYRNYGIPKNQLADWVCMAERESSFNTSAINTKNPDTSWDNGIFQINSQYWCYDPNRPGLSNGCSINCEVLRSDDISASVYCAKIILGESGWGAWVAWKNFCQSNKPNVNNCNL